MQAARGAVDQVFQMPLSGVTYEFARYDISGDNIQRPLRGPVTWELA